MSSLEKRELQFSNVIDRGEALIAQHHPATKTIESHLQVHSNINLIIFEIKHIFLCTFTTNLGLTHYKEYFLRQFGIKLLVKL